MTAKVQWPEPMFVPAGQGAKLNPARAEFAFQIIKGELTIGEMFEVVDMILDGTGFAVGRAASPVMATQEDADDVPELFAQGFIAGVAQASPFEDMGKHMAEARIRIGWNRQRLIDGEGGA